MDSIEGRDVDFAVNSVIFTSITSGTWKILRHGDGTFTIRAPNGFEMGCPCLRDSLTQLNMIGCEKEIGLMYSSDAPNHIKCWEAFNRKNNFFQD